MGIDIDLIKLIDDRVLVKNQTAFGSVLSFEYSTNMARVMLVGCTTPQKIVNRSGEWLSTGDGVEIEYAKQECRIIRRYGEPRPFGQVILLNQSEYDSLDRKKENCLYGIKQGDDE